MEKDRIVDIIRKAIRRWLRIEDHFKRIEDLEALVEVHRVALLGLALTLETQLELDRSQEIIDETYRTLSNGNSE